MIYLIKKNGMVIPHTDLGAMRDLDGVETPDMTVSEAEWEAAGGLARIIGGEIFLGETEAEKAAGEVLRRIGEIDGELEEVNRKAARSVQAIAAAMAKGETPDAGDVEYLSGYEEQAAALREERQGLA